MPEDFSEQQQSILKGTVYNIINMLISTTNYHQYIGMARVPHMRNTNMHRKISAKTERLAVKGCYCYYSAISLSNKSKILARNHC